MSQFSVATDHQENYDGYYDGQSEWRSLCAVDKVRNIVRLCEGLPHRAVLEIGAGDGSVLKGLSDLGFGEELHALEISKSGVDAIRGQGIPNLASCSTFDGYNLPLEDQRVDLAIISHVLEHVEYPRRLLYEAARVARQIFVEVPLEHNLRLARDYVPDAVGHINFYAYGTLRRLVQTCGLEVLEQIVTHPSREVYCYRLGRFKGSGTWLIKQSLLRVAPRFAVLLWTHRSALVCRSPR